MTTQTFWGSGVTVGQAFEYAELSAKLGGYTPSQCHEVAVEPAWSVELSCTN